MRKDARKDLATMFSLMERMEKHMTKSQADNNRSHFLNEAIGEDNTANQFAKGGNGTFNGKVQVNSYLQIKRDDANRKKIVIIGLAPLFSNDINTIVRQVPDATKFTKSGKDGKVYAGIAISKQVPFGGNIAGGKAANTANDVKANAVADDDDDDFFDDDDDEMIDESFIYEVDDDDDDDFFDDDEDGAEDTTTQNQANTPQQGNKVSELYKWLQTTYMKVVSVIDGNKGYDPAYVAKLKDIDAIYTEILATPDNIDSLFVDKNSKQIDDEIAKAIKNGNWDEYLKNNIGKFDIVSCIFGNVLSLRNQHAIKNRAASLGIDPTAQNYPTLVLAPGQWKKFFNRKIVANPAASYPIAAPRSNKVTTKEKGTLGHFQSFGPSRNNGYQVVLGYDISDTEIDDVNDTNDYIHGKAGILNNLTGELNQAAKDYIAQQKAAQDNALTEEEKEAIKDVQSEEGQAKIFNEALMAYVEKFGMNVKINDISQSNQPVVDYAKNLIAFVEPSVQRWANPNNKAQIAGIAAFGIACYTVGTNEVMALSGLRNTNVSLGNAWQQYAASVVQIIHDATAEIGRYLNHRYDDLRNKLNNVLLQTATQQQQTAPAQSQTQAAPAAQSVNENVFDRIENLLFEIMRF